jgi:CDP-diacylglycerol---serine O-phosphatidyltransferase
MEPPFPPFDPEGNAYGKRLRDIPLKSIFPNLLTLLAICSGLTAIRFSIEGRLELAVGAIILAAFLDGIDGRVARFLKSTSRFGAEMDSLADFVNFGVAPAMLLYFSLLDGIRAVGWIVALLFAICACLRLARFNVMLEMPGTPKWQRNFFVGVPAPAGALAGLAPIYAMLLGLEADRAFVIGSALYALAVAFLMVSNIPTFSGKEMTKSIPRAFVLPILVLVVAAIALLLTYPWEMLIAFTVLYILSLPLSVREWRRLQMRDDITDAAATEREQSELR